ADRAAGDERLGRAAVDGLRARDAERERAGNDVEGVGVDARVGALGVDADARARAAVEHRAAAADRAVRGGRRARRALDLRDRDRAAEPEADTGLYRVGGRARRDVDIGVDAEAADRRA